MLPGQEGATGARRELDICYGRSARVQGWQQGQTWLVTRGADVQAGGHGSGLAPAEESIA